MRFYQIPIWREKGDVPREMIPATTPPAVRARVQMIQQNVVMNANNQLAMARQTAEIQRRGNEIAVCNWEWGMGASSVRMKLVNINWDS